MAVTQARRDGQRLVAKLSGLHHPSAPSGCPDGARLAGDVTTGRLPMPVQPESEPAPVSSLRTGRGIGLRSKLVGLAVLISTVAMPSCTYRVTVSTGSGESVRHGQRRASPTSSGLPAYPGTAECWEVPPSLLPGPVVRSLPLQKGGWQLSETYDCQVPRAAPDAVAALYRKLLVASGWKPQLRKKSEAPLIRDGRAVARYRVTEGFAGLLGREPAVVLVICYRVERSPTRMAVLISRPRRDTLAPAAPTSDGRPWSADGVPAAEHRTSPLVDGLVWLALMGTGAFLVVRADWAAREAHANHLRLLTSIRAVLPSLLRRRPPREGNGRMAVGMWSLGYRATGIVFAVCGALGLLRLIVHR